MLSSHTSEYFISFLSGISSPLILKVGAVYTLRRLTYIASHFRTASCKYLLVNHSAISASSSLVIISLVILFLSRLRQPNRWQTLPAKPRLVVSISVGHIHADPQKWSLDWFLRYYRLGMEHCSPIPGYCNQFPVIEEAVHYLKKVFEHLLLFAQSLVIVFWKPKKVWIR